MGDTEPKSKIRDLACRPLSSLLLTGTVRLTLICTLKSPSSDIENEDTCIQQPDESHEMLLLLGVQSSPITHPTASRRLCYVSDPGSLTVVKTTVVLELIV